MVRSKEAGAHEGMQARHRGWRLAGRGCRRTMLLMPNVGRRRGLGRGLALSVFFALSVLFVCLSFVLFLRHLLCLFVCLFLRLFVGFVFSPTFCVFLCSRKKANSTKKWTALEISRSTHCFVECVAFLKKTSFKRRANTQATSSDVAVCPTSRFPSVKRTSFVLYRSYTNRVLIVPRGGALRSGLGRDRTVVRSKAAGRARRHAGQAQGLATGGAMLSTTDVVDAQCWPSTWILPWACAFCFVCLFVCLSVCCLLICFLTCC